MRECSQSSISCYVEPLFRILLGTNRIGQDSLRGTRWPEIYAGARASPDGKRVPCLKYDASWISVSGRTPDPLTLHSTARTHPARRVKEISFQPEHNVPRQTGKGGSATGSYRLLITASAFGDTREEPRLHMLVCWLITGISDLDYERPISRRVPPNI